MLKRNALSSGPSPAILVPEINLGADIIRSANEAHDWNISVATMRVRFHTWIKRLPINRRSFGRLDVLGWCRPNGRLVAARKSLKNMVPANGFEPLTPRV